MFKQTGSTTIRVMAWDENPERPGSKIININVGPPDRTFTEDIGALMVGEEANPLAQLSLLLVLLLGLGYMTRQRRKGGRERALERLDERQNAIFSDEDVGLMPHEVSARRNRPHDPPVNNAFDQSIQGLGETQSGPPIPESGLPEGWTMEQWGHYGQQWLESQSEN